MKLYDTFYAVDLSDISEMCKTKPPEWCKSTLHELIRNRRIEAITNLLI